MNDDKSTEHGAMREAFERNRTMIDHPWAFWQIAWQLGCAAAQARPVDAPTDAEREALALGLSIERAAKSLPDGYAIQVCAERHAGWVELLDPEGENVAPTFDGDHSLSERVGICIDAAMRATPADGGEG